MIEIKSSSKSFSNYIHTKWENSREEFLSKLPKLERQKYMYGDKFNDILIQKLKENKKLSSVDIWSISKNLLEMYFYDSMANRLILPTSKILQKYSKLETLVCKEIIKVAKSHFEEYKFKVEVISSEKKYEELKSKYNKESIKLLGSPELLKQVRVNRFLCELSVKVVNYSTGPVLEEQLDKLERLGAQINYELYDKLYGVNEYNVVLANDMVACYLQSNAIKLYSKNDVNEGLLALSGYCQNVSSTFINKYSDELHVLENYRRLKIIDVYFKLELDNLYKLKSYGNCSLNGSILIKHLIYFNPAYDELSEGLKREYIENLKYCYMANMLLFARGYKTRQKMISRYKYEKLRDETQYFYRLKRRVLWSCIENKLDTTIKVNSQISVLPMLAIILKNRKYIEMSGGFSQDCRKGTYHELVKAIRELPEYKENQDCGVSYEIVQPVVEMYIMGYSKVEMLVVYEFTWACVRSLTVKEKEAMIENILRVLNKIMPELGVLIKFLRKYVDYRIKKYGYISSKLEDSRIDYYYTNGKTEELSAKVMRKRILGDRLKLLNNKIMYKSRIKMVEKSVSKNCYIEGNAYIIHPCDLQNLLRYYNESLVEIKNMSLSEIICDEELNDENSELYKSNKELIEKLKKIIGNTEVIPDDEILGSKYTIVPYNPDHEFERLKSYPGMEWWKL